MVENGKTLSSREVFKALGQDVFRKAEFLLGEDKERILKISDQEYPEYSLLNRQIGDLHPSLLPLVESSDHILTVELAIQRSLLRRSRVEVGVNRKTAPNMNYTTTLSVRSDGKTEAALSYSGCEYTSEGNVFPTFGDFGKAEAGETLIKAFAIILDRLLMFPQGNNPATA